MTAPSENISEVNDVAMENSSSKRTKGRGADSLTADLAEGDYDSLESEGVSGEPAKCFF